MINYCGKVICVCAWLCLFAACYFGGMNSLPMLGGPVGQAGVRGLLPTAQPPQGAAGTRQLSTSFAASCRNWCPSVCHSCPGQVLQHTWALDKRGEFICFTCVHAPSSTATFFTWALDTQHNTDTTRPLALMCPALNILRLLVPVTGASCKYISSTAHNCYILCNCYTPPPNRWHLTTQHAGTNGCQALGCNATASAATNGTSGARCKHQ
jgi:hypothetical protein